MATVVCLVEEIEFDPLGDSTGDKALLWQGKAKDGTFVCKEKDDCAGDAHCGFPGVGPNETKAILGVKKAPKTCCPTKTRSVDNICKAIPEGKYCKDPTFCVNKNCGRPGDPSFLKICCPNGTYSSGGIEFCRGLPAESRCNSEKGCELGACGHPGSTTIKRICCSSGKTYHHSIFSGDKLCSLEPLGSQCTGDRGCVANTHCTGGTCVAGARDNTTRNIIIVVSIIAVIIIAIVILYVVVKVI